MWKSRKKGVALVALAAAVGLSCFSPALAKKPGGGGGGGDGGGGGGYTILLLDPDLPFAVKQIVPNALNEYDSASDSQSAVGFAVDDNNGYYPIFWNITGGSVTAFHLSGGSVPCGVNSDNEIVGYRNDYIDGHLVQTAWYWPNPLAEPINLAPLAGHDQCLALSINDQGFIVGSSIEMVPSANKVDENGNPVLVRFGHPVAWRVTYVAGEVVVSGPLDLGALAANKRAGAADVAEAQPTVDANGDPALVARVAGYSQTADGQGGAVMWEVVSFLDDQGSPQLAVPSGPTDLGTVAGTNWSTSATAINNHGDVCGDPGFLNRFGQPMEALADLQGTTGGLALPSDINDQAEVVGPYYYGIGANGVGFQSPVLWQSDGTPVDLNKYIGGIEFSSLGNPTAINNLGAIVGCGGRYSSGKKNSSIVPAAYIMIPN